MVHAAIGHGGSIPVDCIEQRDAGMPICRFVGRLCLRNYCSANEALLFFPSERRSTAASRCCSPSRAARTSWEEESLARDPWTQTGNRSGQCTIISSKVSFCAADTVILRFCSSCFFVVFDKIRVHLRLLLAHRRGQLSEVHGLIVLAGKVHTCSDHSYGVAPCLRCYDAAVSSGIGIGSEHPTQNDLMSGLTALCMFVFKHCYERPLEMLASKKVRERGTTFATTSCLLEENSDTLIRTQFRLSIDPSWACS